jgi:hypothetical protein
MALAEGQRDVRADETAGILGRCPAAHVTGE